MKTLIITLEYPPQIGGIASYTYNFAAHLPAADVVVLAPVMPGGDEFDKNNGWKTYRRSFFWLLWPRWLRLFIQVWAIVRKEKIEQLYIHHALPVGYVAKIVKLFFRIPYTVFLHGTDIEVATRNWWKRRLFADVCMGAKQVVVNSLFIQNKLSARLPGITKILALYPCAADDYFNPINLDILNHLKSRLALDGKKVILTVARLSVGKGHMHVLSALPQLVAHDPDLVWLVVGDGPISSEMMAFIQKNNLQNEVRMVGNVAPDKLPAYYQIASLFVLLTHATAQGEEGWGTVFLEAAASGLPVVAGRVGGVEEAVEHRKTGILVDANNHFEVINTIVDLLNKPQYARELGVAGRERAQSEFRWEKQMVKISNLK